MTRTGVLAGLLVASAAAPLGTALADVDLTVSNGDKITSAIDAGGEVESFRFHCPAGAVVSVKAKTAKKGPPLRVRAFAPDESQLGEGTGPAASVTNKAAPATGVYTAEVSAADGAAGTAYSVTVSWKSPKKFGAAPTLDPGGQSQVTFAGDAGATATFAVKKGKRSAAVPVVLSLTGPDGDVTLTPGASVTVELPSTGDYTLTIGDTGAEGGAVTAAVKVKQPKPLKRTADIGTSGVPAGTAFDSTGLIGPPGGTLSAELDGPIAGASVTVPAGALSQATSLLIGTTSVIATTAPGVSAGPAIFLGPEGLSFAPAQVQVTIPFDASFFADGTSSLRVYTRAADGSITEITGFTIDAVASTVSFAVSHFSTFEVRRAFPLVERPQLATPPNIGAAQLGMTGAVSNDVAVFGLQFYDPDGIHQNAGSLVVYHRETDGTWTAEGKLSTPNYGANDALGASVAASGATIVGGAPFRTPTTQRTGAGEVWTRDVAGTWQFESELVPPGGAFGWEGGFGVAIDGDTAVLGVHGDAADVNFGGSAQVFVRTGNAWFFQARLTEATPVVGGKFAGSVAIDGDTLVAGSYESTQRAGSVDVFHRSGITWTLAGRIVAPDGFTNDSFGTRVAVSAGRIAVGAPRLGADGGGEVYVFRDEGTSFPLEAVIPTIDPARPTLTGGDFGSSVALHGAVLVVGIPHRDVIGPFTQFHQSAGQVLVYESSSSGKWLLTARLRGSSIDAYPATSGTHFGTSVGFDGESIVVGAPQDAFGVGALYAFDVR